MTLSLVLLLWDGLYVLFTPDDFWYSRIQISNSYIGTNSGTKYKLVQTLRRGEYLHGAHSRALSYEHRIEEIAASSDVNCTC